MYKADEFREYFGKKVGAAPNTVNTYISFLNKIDKTLGGLDEAIGRDGTDAIWEWGKTTERPPFDTYASHARSVLKRYLTFLIDREAPSEPLVEPEEETGPAADSIGSFFQLEREMHAAVRQQLTQIEEGLHEGDGGTEVATATGRVDIVARDAANVLVAIELKAGDCTSGALEQVLGYAQALSEERGERVRAILIAASFSDRLRAAAKRTTDTKLLTYQFALRFTEQ